MDYQQHFNRYGYIHIRGALTPDEVASAREKVFDLFDVAAAETGKQVRDLWPSLVYQQPWLYGLQFKPQIVKALRAILQPDYAVVPDLLVSRNQCGGWHWDSSPEGKQPYLYAPDYRFVKCGIYLQENTAEFGGGVDIVPGRHTWPVKTGNVNLDFKVKTAFDLFGQRFRAVRADLKPGDFLAFHSCLPHQSTQPTALMGNLRPGVTVLDDVAKDKTKLVIYWDAGRLGSLDGYMQNACRRAERELAGEAKDALTGGHPFHAEMVAMRFPEDYPADFVELVRQNGLNVAGIDRGEALRMRERLAHQDQAMAS